VFHWFHFFMHHPALQRIK